MESADPTGRWRSSWSRFWPVIPLLLIGLVVGLWWGNDYGLSLDEAANAEAGSEALLAYVGAGEYFSLPSLDDHGPVYFMLFVSTSRAIHNLAPSWSLADGRHLTNFLVFLAGVSAFYFLALRFMRRRYAWMATVLFATQPLLFGHAFINQKDIPFLTSFLLAAVVGLAWIDRLPLPADRHRGDGASDGTLSARTRAELLASDWRHLPARRRGAFVLGCVAAGYLALDLAVLGGVEGVGRSLIQSAFVGAAPGPIQRLFDLVATDAYKTPVALYLAKYESVMLILRQLLVPSLLLGLAIACSIALPSLGELLGLSKRFLLQPPLIAGGVLLGVLICIRQVGAFVGILVSLAVLARRRTRAAFPLVVYWGLAVVVTLATWPYLWANPLGRFVQSVVGVARFASHDVLFWGRTLNSTELPWSYFPTLAGLELTEPVVLLVVLAIGVVAWRVAVGPKVIVGIDHVFLIAWLAVPFLGLILLSPSIYGNIRQLLFMLPPLFVLAGLGLQKIGSVLRFKGSSAVLIAVAVFPGVLSIIRLHPYEYAYFNALSGGLAGAEANFALDPWCISYREAAEVADRLASPGAMVLAIPRSSQVEPYLRKEVNLLRGRADLGLADIVMTCTYRDSESWPTGDFELVYQVERDGAVLSKVWVRRGYQPP